MWSLVKSEMLYFKWLFIFSSILVLLINIGLTIDNRWIEAQADFPGLRVIWLGVGIIVLFFTILFNRKSGRLRTKILLPLSRTKISISRWFAFFIFWMALIVSLIIFFFINYEGSLDKDWFINLLSLSGIMFFIISIPILYSDLYNTYYKKSEKLFFGFIWIILFILYIWLNIIFSTYLDFLAPELLSGSRSAITTMFFTKEAIISSTLLGTIMFLSTIHTFRKRKFFLE